MIRSASLLIAGLLALPALAVAEQALPPILDVSIADGQRLVQHWKASIYGQVWNSPALAPLRAKLDAAAPEIAAQLGIDPFPLLGALVSARFQLTGMTAGEDAKPAFIAQLDLGAAAAKAFTDLAASGEAFRLAGSDQAVRFAEQDLVLARFGSVLVVGPAGAPLAMGAVPASTHDLSVRFSGKALDAALQRAAVEPAAKLRLERLRPVLAPYLVPAQADLDLVADGLQSRFTADTVLSWLAPVDRAWCGHLPAAAYSCGGIGIDGRALWRDLVQPLIGALGAEDGKTAAEAEQQADQALKGAGLACTWADLVGGLTGTVFTANTPGSPFPGYTIGVPRSAAIDQVVAFALKKLESEAPAEGQSTMLAVPNLPLPLSLIRSAGSWVITTDQVLATTWGAEATGDWMASPVGKLCAEKVGKNACQFTVGDTAAELRTMQGYLGMGVGAAPLPPGEKQAIMQAYNQLLARSGLAYEVTAQDGKQLSGEGRGLLAVGSSSVAVVAIVAAIAIPNLLESRVASNDAAAGASLKSGVFPAEVQFQAGGYHDRDQDGIGDFGFFAEMAGGPIPGAKDGVTLSLLPATWNADNPELNGYRFAVYLPDGAGGALAAGQDRPVAKSGPGQGPSTGFVAYAWPIDAAKGRRAFAITAAGTLLSVPAKQLGGKPPAWNDVFGGKGWKDPVTWPVSKR